MRHTYCLTTCSPLPLPLSPSPAFASPHQLHNTLSWQKGAGPEQVKGGSAIKTKSVTTPVSLSSTSISAVNGTPRPPSSSHKSKQQGESIQSEDSFRTPTTSKTSMSKLSQPKEPFLYQDRSSLRSSSLSLHANILNSANSGSTTLNPADMLNRRKTTGQIIHKGSKPSEPVKVVHVSESYICP
jgi:hypothetical protein